MSLQLSSVSSPGDYRAKLRYLRDADRFITKVVDFDILKQQLPSRRADPCRAVTSAASYEKGEVG